MRILIIKLSAAGDLFHALPAVHNLKIKLKADIDWVVQKEYLGLAKCFTDVDRVIPFHRRAFLANLIPFLKKLRAMEYDYIIDLQGLLKSALVTRLARGKKRIGPSFHREGTLMFYSAVAGNRNKSRHAVEENLDIIRYLRTELIEPEFPVSFPAKNLSAKRPRVAMLPVSRWRTKNWPAWCFIDLARQLQKKNDVSLFLLGGLENVEVCKEIEEALDGGVVNMAGKSTLVETGGILKEMDLLIANDSGPVHMAVAIGTPTLVLFGPTDPKRTGPYGNGHRVVKASLSCQPCFSRTCNQGEVPCLANVTPGRVAKMAGEMLGRSTHV